MFEINFKVLKEAQKNMDEQEVPTENRWVFYDGEWFFNGKSTTAAWYFGESSIEYQKGSIFDPENIKPEGETHE